MQIRRCFERGSSNGGEEIGQKKKYQQKRECRLGCCFVSCEVPFKIGVASEEAEPDRAVVLV